MVIWWIHFWKYILLLYTLFLLKNVEMQTNCFCYNLYSCIKWLLLYVWTALMTGRKFLYVPLKLFVGVFIFKFVYNFKIADKHMICTFNVLFIFQEFEVKFKPWLTVMLVFTGWRVIAILYRSIVNVSGQFYRVRSKLRTIWSYFNKICNF